MPPDESSPTEPSGHPPAAGPSGHPPAAGPSGDPPAAGPSGDPPTAARHDVPVAAAADEDVVDALPEDLDVSAYVGPYTFPDNNRRRIPGYLYLAVAAATVVLWAATRGRQPVLVNDGFLWAALALALVGAYSIAAGFDLAVDEQDALVVATRRVGFPVGHASAQLGWRGLRSRPTWRLLLYSADNPPARRALVLVDGVDGEVVDWFAEDNPEDWSDLEGSLARSGDRAPRA
ncbi:MAG: hypothetical protein HYX34_02365 [Actinobacteria bacterium]|nr:hypothetical protein [Actinomycetota bacterium]